MRNSTPCRAGTLAIVIAAAVMTFSAPAAAQSADTEAKAAPDAEQVLRPGDLIRLQIWREPELSGDYVVDEEGVVVLPLIGARIITNMPPEAIKQELVDAYAEYLTHRSIDVTLMRRINVLGAVGNPGLYPVDPTMTIADALALAGGATPQGDPDRVDLLRDGNQLTTRLSQQTLIGDLPIRSGDQLFVPERSWISRNANVVAAIISASVSIIIAITR